MQKKHQDHLASMHAMAMSKVQYAMQDKFQEKKEELWVDLKDEKWLEFGNKRIDKLMKEGGHNEELDEAVGALQSWLNAAKVQQWSASSPGNDQGERHTRRKCWRYNPTHNGNKWEDKRGNNKQYQTSVF